MIFSGQQQGDRPYQEDSIWSGEINGVAVLIVADGLGGHDAGDTASALIIECLRNELAAQDALVLSEDNAKSWFQHALEAFQSKITAGEDAKDAHTTLACALISNDELLTISVGDSRIYHVSNGELWRTKDHSVVQMLLDDGEIEESDMATHPEQGKLYRSIGPKKHVKPRVKKRAIQTGDGVLVCSDGFWEAFSPDDIINLMADVSKNALNQLLCEAATKFSPKSDNVSAVLYSHAKTAKELDLSTTNKPNAESTTDSEKKLMNESTIDVSKRARDRTIIAAIVFVLLLVVYFLVQSEEGEKSDAAIPLGVEESTTREACLIDGIFIATSDTSRIRLRSSATGEVYEVVLPLARGKYEIVLDDAAGECSRELDAEAEAELKRKIEQSIYSNAI